MSYYCKGEICERSNECLRAEAWRNFPGNENTEGLWLVHEPTCVRNDFEDGVFRSSEEQTGCDEDAIKRNALERFFLKNCIKKEEL